METPPPPEQLLKKIQVLGHVGHAHSKQEMSKFMLRGNGSGSGSKLGDGNQISHSVLAHPRRNDDWVHDQTMGETSSFRNSSLLRMIKCDSHDLPRPRREIGFAAVICTPKSYMNILQSMGLALHMVDINGRVIYWNRTAEQIYGYSDLEALGQDIIELIAEPPDFDDASEIVKRCSMGQNWTGEFPVKNKLGERFLAMFINTPLYDDLGCLVGIISVSGKSQPFLEEQFPFSYPSSSTRPPSTSGPTTKSGQVDSYQQPLQVVIASKISNIASRVTNKVRSKIRTSTKNTVECESRYRNVQYSNNGFFDTVISVDHRKDANSSGGCRLRGNISPFPFGAPSKDVHGEQSPRKLLKDSDDDKKGKIRIHKIITSRADAEEWIREEGVAWPLKGSKQHGLVVKSTHGIWLG